MGREEEQTLNQTLPDIFLRDRTIDCYYKGKYKLLPLDFTIHALLRSAAKNMAIKLEVSSLFCMDLLALRAIVPH